MEEMSTVTVPFRMKNINGEESAFKAQIEIAGIKVARIFAKHRVDFGKLIGGDGEKDVQVEFEPELKHDGNGGAEKSVVIVPQASRRAPAMDYVPLWGMTSICGGRSEMEDAGAVVPRLVEIPSEMLGDINRGSLVAHFFGVYDGHGGSQVADYCSRRMHTALVEEMDTAKSSFCDRTADRGLGRGHLERAFSGCFQKVDDEVGGVLRGGDDSSIHVEAVTPDTVGSTAIVALICTTHIIVANCGDSRAVLYRGKEPMALSVDHKVRPSFSVRGAASEHSLGRTSCLWRSRNVEVNRYVSAAPVDHLSDHLCRVMSCIELTRDPADDPGDRYLKPSIIPDPEVLLLPHAREDECLILASDGLWDVITNEEACEIARKRILLWHKKNGETIDGHERGKGADPAAQAAADHLTRLAIQKGSRDNITVIVVDLKAQRKFKKKAAPEAPIVADTNKSS